jgi:hypothetical protein
VKKIKTPTSGGVVDFEAGCGRMAGMFGSSAGEIWLDSRIAMLRYRMYSFRWQKQLLWNLDMMADGAPFVAGSCPA